jgi:hypothetical protein
MWRAKPDEAGGLGRFADHEWRYGWVSDRTPACRCWHQEGAVVIVLSARESAGIADREAVWAESPTRGDTTGSSPEASGGR